MHYSFVYDVSLRFAKNTPRIFQITASGIKNEFPRVLLHVFDQLNHWLYHKHSPLNWLTRRRFMKIRARKPSDHKGRTLCHKSGIGLLSLKDNCEQVEAAIIRNDGNNSQFH